jgi:hypothetical protein
MKMRQVTMLFVIRRREAVLQVLSKINALLPYCNALGKPDSAIDGS